MRHISLIILVFLMVYISIYRFHLKSSLDIKIIRATLYKTFLLFITLIYSFAMFYRDGKSQYTI
jgi:hypothetical protein